MGNRFPLVTISATFLLGILVFLFAPKTPDVTQVLNVTTSNIIFRYGVSGAKHMNELDTFRGIFIMDMVNKDPVRTRMNLTQEELNTIYQKMVDIEFFTYPNVYNPKLGDIQGKVTPFFIYYLEYEDETGTKVVQWNDEHYAPGDTKYNKLKKLSRLIMEIIQARPEYQKLPEPTAVYV